MEQKYDLEKLFSNVETLKGTLSDIILLKGANRQELDDLRDACSELKGADAILKKALNEVKLELNSYITENKLSVRFTFKDKADFNTPEPYAEVFSYAGDKFRHQMELNKMADEAKAAGFTGFKKAYQAYISTMRLTNKASEDKSNPTDFPNQPVELEAGQWLCDVEGVKLVDGQWGTQVACCHPIMPVERLVNIDTGEEKIKLAFCKSRRWRDIVVSKEVTAVASKITALAAKGVAVTSENAKLLVRYLCDIENLNLEEIPEHESVSRLGYVDEGRFSPYVDGLIFDGEASYKPIFKAISESKGNFEDWLKVAKKCRSESLVARLILSASFSSVLVKHIGALPYFVHLWSCESGTGKTVALMLAASVWGNPEPGTYIQSFNSTTVGHEKMAAFLNNIPLCIDELQLSKDNHGRSRFDVYQLAQGVGRTRGNKAGGVDATPTWANCILTTGETPIVRDGAGAGAINRVIDLECQIGEKVILDGQGTANTVKANYGQAGRKFVESLDIERAKKLYDFYFEKLSESETTEKQCMAAAIILTADALTSEMFFDTKPLDVSQMSKFLKSKAAVSAGERGYQCICDWVAMNIGNFLDKNGFPRDEKMPGKIYGQKGEQDWIYINQSVFRNAVEEAGYNDRALLSYLKSNDLIQTRGRNMTKGKRIEGILTECILLKLPDMRYEIADDIEIL
ncbi:MAG: DUF927 domain-containing protein [Oscillospiraceae bacterium]|nr:DUF927 domain-containing protein [Oscillospiraceae bacterium]